MSIEALLTKIVEQNTKLIDSIDRKDQVILKLVTQLSEQMDDEGKGSGSLDGD